MSETSDKRIVKNTFFVYLRLFVVTVISLVSTRFVLQALGASDFGLYNIVGSKSTVFNRKEKNGTDTNIRPRTAFIKKLTRIPQPLQAGDELCKALPG